MNAINKSVLASAMMAAAGLPAHPHRGLQTRDKGSLDDASAQLRDRIGKIDELLNRYKDKFGELDNVPANLKDELETRAKEIKDLSGQVEDIQQKLVDGVQGRSMEHQNDVAAMLIRNKDAVDYAKTMYARSGNKKDAVVFDGLNARNVITLAGVGGGIAAKAHNELARTAVTMPLAVIDLINWAPTTEAVAYFLRESTYNIMADIAPENTEKPESDFAFGVETLAVGTIAHWIRASKQVLADMPMLATYLETRMAYGIRYKLEYFVVNGHKPASGQQKHFGGLLEAQNHRTIAVPVDATSIDVLNVAKYEAAASYVIPDTIILNPKDWGVIERIKGDDGHYVFGSPGAQVQPVLWGLPVVFAASMPEGKYWVGNLALGYDGVLREDVTVTVSTEDSANFIKNLVTILAEMRAAGTVVLPEACVAGDLPSAPVATGG